LGHFHPASLFFCKPALKQADFCDLTPLGVLSIWGLA
jgi:hypothetical protein